MAPAPAPYADRRHAGRLLARHLAAWRSQPATLVLALPRGGVAVGYEVAHFLKLPLDLCVVRKLGVPGHEEYAMGAIASGGVRVANPGAAAWRLDPAAVQAVVARELGELARRERLYRGDRSLPALQGRTVLLVDDGLATGATMRAAAQAVRLQGAAQVVAAAPVGSAQAVAALRHEADKVVCPLIPEPFEAVGLWYRDFPQASDDEVARLLRAAHAP